MVLLESALVSPSWWDVDWSSKKNITITGGSETITNFTVFLNVSYDSDMQSDFDDLRFVNGSETGTLDCELEYKVDSITAHVWCRIPSLVTGNSLIWMYYNKPTATSNWATKTAWDTKFLYVLHGEETGTNWINTVGNANATLYTLNFDTKTYFGNSTYFDGGSGHFANATNKALTAGNSVTVLSMINSSTPAEAKFMSAVWYWENPYLDKRSWLIARSTGNQVRTILSANGVDAALDISSAATLPNGGWGQYGIKINATKTYLYVNGNLDSATGATVTLYNSPAPLELGIQEGGGNNGNRLTGFQDEFYIYDGAMSDAWVNRTYQNANLTYTSFGTEINNDDTTPPTCVLLSRYPTDINVSSTGPFNIILNCTDPSGINVTKTGDRYWAFATRTLEGFLTPGLPNRWSIRPPSNNLAQTDPVLSAYGKIFRAQGRGRSFWYENLTITATLTKDSNLTSWLLADNYSYAAEDGHYGLLTLTQESTTSAIFNYTSPSVRVSVFRQNIPISYNNLVSEMKKNISINKNVQVLIYRNDLEAMKGSPNYTITIFRNIGTTATAPNANLRVFYCNKSYNPNGGITVLASSNCVSTNALTSVQLSTIVLTDRNSSYSSGTFAVTNGKIGGIVATDYQYTYYDTLESNPTRAYKVAYANGSTVTNVTFKDTNRTWTSSNSGATWSPFAGTIDMMSFTTKVSDEFQFGYCVYDLVGNFGCNKTIVTDLINETGHAISFPSILEYNSSYTLNDFDLSGIHKGIMNIRIGCSRDPDSVGNVTHNLSLRNEDGTYNLSINSSFLCPDDAQTWINFNTSLGVNQVKYKMNLTATSGDDPTDIKSYLTYNNFTIDNTPISPYPQKIGWFLYFAGLHQPVNFTYNILG